MFEKTTILPTDDPALAKELFDRLIFEEPNVLFVVQGGDDSSKALVERAARLAGKPGHPRWVCWIRDAKVVEPITRKLKGTKNLLGRIPEARAYALSLTDTVRDVLDEKREPDLMRIHLAWKRAEADK